MGNEQPFDQWTRFICIAFATHYRLGRQQAALINTDTRCAACRAVAQSMLDRRRSPFPFYSRVMVVFRPKFINCREEDRDRLVLSVTIHSSCIGICDTLAVVVEVKPSSSSSSRLALWIGTFQLHVSLFTFPSVWMLQSSAPQIDATMLMTAGRSTDLIVPYGCGMNKRLDELSPGQQLVSVIVGHAIKRGIEH